MAAVSGTVVNGATGKPQAGATVGFYKLANGLELVEQVKSDARGDFIINRNPEGQSLIRTTFDGVAYNHALPPGSPTTQITLEVFNSSKRPGGAKVAKHMILFQPSGGEMAVNETFLLDNDGKTAWNDPASGTLRFYLPAAAKGKAEVNATAPEGMPIRAALLKSPAPDVFGVDFPIRPGETRIDLSYAVPYTEGEPYQGKIVSRDETTYLIAPDGVTLTGDNLSDKGVEPRTRTHIYVLTAAAYKIALTGAPAAARESPSEDSAAASDGAPQVEEIMPRVFGQAPLILGFALAILALGFAILYRASESPKETNERRRG